MSISIPIGFHFGLWAAALLALVSLINVIAQHQLGNRSLSTPQKLAFIALILYWLIHVVSLFYGGDPAIGLQIIEKKAVLLIFALCFLLSDTSYIQKKHFRCFFYALLVSICGVFLYNLGVGISKLIDGKAMASMFSTRFDLRHHAYVSLYIDTALAFIYVELSSRWKNIQNLVKIALIVSVPLLILYLHMINSRAGILVMWLVAAICVIHMSFFKHSWKIATVIAIIFTGCTLGISNIIPRHVNRIVATIVNTKDKDVEPDHRVSITHSTLELALEKPIIGYGVNRYRNVIAQSYTNKGFNIGVKAQFNAHNQYLETILAVGVFGVIFMLAFFLIPLWQAWKNRRYFLPTFLIVTIFCVNLLFESMLERQMGLLFVGFFMSVAILAQGRALTEQSESASAGCLKQVAAQNE